MSRESATASIRSLGLGTGLVLLVAVSTGLTSLLVGVAVKAIAGDRMAPWILGRASGITAYLLVVALVFIALLGLTLVLGRHLRRSSRN